MGRTERDGRAVGLGLAGQEQAGMPVAAGAPRVTVVMTVYNGMPYLPAAVGSILNQTYRDFRLMVIDDGSTDGSGAYLDGIEDPRVDVVHQANEGQHRAANRAISLARTELIARMDADDVADPERLARQVAFLDANPSVGLVGGQVLRMGRGRASGQPSHLPTGHDEIVEHLLANRHGMCNATTMFRRDLYHQIGGYWEHDIAEDWDLFLRLGEVAELANLDDVVLSMRFHTGSINGRRTAEAQLLNEYAADRARSRAAGRPEASLDDFRRRHRSARWPGSLLFRLDALALGHYRIAVADLHDGRRAAAAVRLALAVLCSPSRALFRVRGAAGARWRKLTGSGRGWRSGAMVV